MTKIYFFSVLITGLIVSSCVKEIKNNDTNESKVDFALVIHGGAGYIYEGRYTTEEEKEYKFELEKALNLGYDILENNGSAVDAVETVIRVLEDSPLFNAGKGAVFNDKGNVELDASIMDGKEVNSGGVASITNVKNPITLARFVMEHSPHVLLFGDGAEKFADEFGLEKVENEYFKTDGRIEEFKKIKSKNHAELLPESKKFGTVGCAALDKNGNLAAGTSTGGMMGKKYGRIGDSPIIGAGTYANNNSCAISATGHGEFFIRNVVAYDIAALMKYEKMNIKKAANLVVNKKLKDINASGGVVGLDKYGNVVMSFNTQGMFRGYRVSGNDPVIKMYK